MDMLNIINKLKEETLGSRLHDSLKTLLSISMNSPYSINEKGVRVNISTINDGNLNIVDFIPVDSSNTTGLIDVEVKVIDISHSIIFGNGNILKDNSLYSDDFRSVFHEWRNKGFYGKGADEIGFILFNRDNDTCVIPERLMLKQKEMHNTAFYFHSNHSYRNFGHFVHDFLSQLLAFDRLQLIYPSIQPIFTGPLRYNMQNFLLMKLVKNADLNLYIPADGCCRVHQCFTTSSIFPGPETGAINLKSFRYLKKKINSLVSGISNNYDGNKIFINRKDAMGGGRLFSNLYEVEKIFESHGYLSVSAGSLSPIDAINLFSSATHLAGIHGAGLLNFIFSRDPRFLYEMCDYPSSWESIHWVAKAFDIDAHRIPSFSDGNSVSIDLDAIKSLFKS